MLEKILDLIFPKFCLSCGKQGEGYICSSCFSFEKSKLNLSIIEAKEELFDYFVYISEYKEEFREKILYFKFYDHAYLAEYFIELIEKSKKIDKFLKSFDCIVPVPMSRSKKKRRGYNQTELLAKALGKKLEIFVERNLLIKVKENKTQSLLDLEERIDNVKGVYSINKKIIKEYKGRSIVLLDDIFTTGATTRECCKILKENRHSKNMCVSFGKGLIRHNIIKRLVRVLLILY